MLVAKILLSYSLLFWLVLLIDQSSAFIPDKCSMIELESTPSNLLNAAKCVDSFFDENPELAKHLPSVTKVVNDVVYHGIAFFKENPAIAVPSIYTIGILMTSYYLTNDARAQLMEAQFQHEELDMIIDTGIMPLLEYVDTAMKGGLKRGTIGFCRARHDFKETLKSAIDELRKERKSIESKMIDLSSGETRSEILKWISGGVGGSATVWAAAVCASTGPACPAVAGSGMAISSLFGYFLFGGSQSTYQQSLKTLALARERAFEAEKLLRNATSNIDRVCLELMMEPSWTNWLLEKIFLGIAFMKSLQPVPRISRMVEEIE